MGTIENMGLDDTQTSNTSPEGMALSGTFTSTSPDTSHVFILEKS